MNASRTGVLFQAGGEEYDKGTAIELELELPGSTRGACVHCTGSVVRCERRESEALRIAATIDVYQFGSEGGPTTHSLPGA